MFPVIILLSYLFKEEKNYLKFMSIVSVFASDVTVDIDPHCPK